MRVLLIEDDNQMIAVFQALLSYLGHDLTTAKTVLAPVKCDLVLLNMGMNGQLDKGLEILRAIKQAQPWQRVGIVSADDARNLIAGAEAGGAEFYLIPPLSLPALDALIKGTPLPDLAAESGRLIFFKGGL
jgi:CheY-like chemotaxis protein